MAQTSPLTADQMLAALAKWGIKPRFYKSDWRTHNRGQRGAGWGPVINGFLVHNFASDISDASSLAYLYNGDDARGMPGPLSQFAIDDAGAVWVIGWGRANHGGVGDPGFVDALAYDRLSLTADYRPATAGTVDMNSRTYGVEMLYGKAPTQAQRDSVVRLAAALMDAHGYAATSVGGHRESTTQRGDPVGFQMGPLRTQIAAALKAGPGTTPTPAPAPSGGFTVADIKDAQVLLTGSAIMKDALNPANKNRVAASYLIEGSAQYAKSADERSARLEKAVAALDAKLSAVKVDPAALAAAVVAALPAGQGQVTQATVEAALRNVLGSLAP